MFKHIAMTTVATAALFVSLQASAYSPNNGHDSINKEQREQAVMIQQGIKTCEITPREAQTLRATQSRIAAMEKKFKANGMRSWERKTLQEKLHAARVEINQFTKNRTTCRSESKRDDRRYDDRKHGTNNRTSSSSRADVKLFNGRSW